MLKVCPPCQNEYCFSTYFSWQVHQLGEASPGPARYNVQGELAKYLGEVHQVEENGFDPKIMGWEWLLRFVWYIYTYFSIVFIYLFSIYLFIYITNIQVDCWRYMIAPPWGQHFVVSHHHEMKVFSDLPGQQVWIGPEDSQREGNVGSIAGLKKALGTSRKFIQHPCCFEMFVWFCDGTKYHQPKHLIHFDLFRWSQNAWEMFRVTSVHCLSCAQARFPRRVSTSVLACLEEMC